MKARLGLFVLLLPLLASAQSNKSFSDTVTKPAPIILDVAEAKAVEDWEAAGKQLAQQWDSALGELLTAPVDCIASMQAHAKLKDIGSKRALLTEQLRTMKQTHRLAHNCPTCEYQDSKSMIPSKGGDIK